MTKLRVRIPCVYFVPNLSVKRWAGAFCSCASRINLRIPSSALSRDLRTTFKSTLPQRFNVPASTEDPASLSTGAASPVRLDSSAAVFPSITSASTGKESPGRTRTFMPGSNASTETRSSVPSSRTRIASLGAALKRPASSRSVRYAANSSKAPLRENKNSSNAPSPHAPRAAAPTATASIKKWISNTRVFSRCHTSSAVFQLPATYEMTKNTIRGQPSAKDPANPASPHPIASANGTFHFFPAPTTEGNVRTSNFTPCNTRHNQNLGAVMQLSRSR